MSTSASVWKREAESSRDGISVCHEQIERVENWHTTCQENTIIIQQFVSVCNEFLLDIKGKNNQCQLTLSSIFPSQADRFFSWRQFSISLHNARRSLARPTSVELRVAGPSFPTDASSSCQERRLFTRGTSWSFSKGSTHGSMAWHSTCFSALYSQRNRTTSTRMTKDIPLPWEATYCDTSNRTWLYERLEVPWEQWLHSQNNWCSDVPTTIRAAIENINKMIFAVDTDTAHELQHCLPKAQGGHLLLPGHLHWKTAALSAWHRWLGHDWQVMSSMADVLPVTARCRYERGWTQAMKRASCDACTRLHKDASPQWLSGQAVLHGLDVCIAEEGWKCMETNHVKLSGKKKWDELMLLCTIERCRGHSNTSLLQRSMEYWLVPDIAEVHVQLPYLCMREAFTSSAFLWRLASMLYAVCSNHLFWARVWPCSWFYMRYDQWERPTRSCCSLL